MVCSLQTDSLALHRCALSPRLSWSFKLAGDQGAGGLVPGSHHRGYEPRASDQAQPQGSRWGGVGCEEYLCVRACVCVCVLVGGHPCCQGLVKTRLS